MSIIAIINIVVSLGIFLGGICMIKYAESPVDYSIGFKTEKAMLSKEAWHFANQKCGSSWEIIGIVSFVLSLVSIFIFVNDKTLSIIQFTILLLLIASVIVSAIVVQIGLKKFDDNTK